MYSKYFPFHYNRGSNNYFNTRDSRDIITYRVTWSNLVSNHYRENHRVAVHRNTLNNNIERPFRFPLFFTQQRSQAGENRTPRVWVEFFIAYADSSIKYRAISSSFLARCLAYFVSVQPLSASFLCYKVPLARRLLSALCTESIWTLRRPRHGSACIQVDFGRCTFIMRDLHVITANSAGTTNPMWSINREHDTEHLRDVPRSSQMIAFPVYSEQVSKFARYRRFPMPLNTFARILDSAHCYGNGIRSTVQSHRANRNGMARRNAANVLS